MSYKTSHQDTANQSGIDFVISSLGEIIVINPDQIVKNVLQCSQQVILNS
jgi:hypothetical protein